MASCQFFVTAAKPFSLIQHSNNSGLQVLTFFLSWCFSVTISYGHAVTLLWAYIWRILYRKSSVSAKPCSMARGQLPTSMHASNARSRTFA